MADQAQTQKVGNRKSKVSWQSQLALLIGFVIAAAMKAPVELYVAYVIGIGGTSFSFMWANAQVHKARDKDNPTA